MRKTAFALISLRVIRILKKKCLNRAMEEFYGLFFFLILHSRIKCESRERRERQCVLLDPAQGRGLGLKQFRLTWSPEAKRPPGRELRFGLRVPCPIHLSLPVLLSHVPECGGDSSTLSC